jgi:hypothetical protein
MVRMALASLEDAGAFLRDFAMRQGIRRLALFGSVLRGEDTTRTSAGTSEMMSDHRRVCFMPPGCNQIVESRDPGGMSLGFRSPGRVA